MNTKPSSAELKPKNKEVRERGARARRRGEVLASNPYLDRESEVVSQAMREHKAQLWTRGWKWQDLVGGR